MSWEKFEDDCDGCRPAILDMTTKQPLPPHSPEMQAINKVWDNDTTPEQRQAYHQVCCLNSREPEDLKLSQEIVVKIQQVLESLSN
jgi:hypothetical protein